MTLIEVLVALVLLIFVGGALVALVPGMAATNSSSGAQQRATVAVSSLLDRARLALYQDFSADLSSFSEEAPGGGACVISSNVVDASLSSSSLREPVPAWEAGAAPGRDRPRSNLRRLEARCDMGAQTFVFAAEVWRQR